ncbi:MAG: ribonuclease P protein component, partial [Candidatus Margulisbacteria bacterium]|nr:ribonuclease P protein component [Candidatus Margulisiibacteriota bacterium]
MLSKNNRVNRSLIEEVFKKGKFINSPNLTLKFINISQKSLFSKISFIVPRVVSKKAVVRNLIRRRGYSVLREHINKLPIDFVGVFIFGKRSSSVFGGKKNREYNPIQNLKAEIETILN